MGDEEDRLAELGLEAEELVLEPLAVDRVDRAEGLVHQHHARVRGERAGDADALLLAAGELRRVAVGELGVEADQRRAARRRAPRGARESQPSSRGDGGDVLGDRAVREEADLLDHVADLAPQLGRGAVADRACRR